MKQEYEPHQPTVLCVDDEHHVLSALERVLHRFGCRVLIASFAVEAFYYLSHEHIDVVISDEAMPEIRGTELLRQVKEHVPAAARVLLTAHYRDDRVVLPAFNEGVLFRLLPKPWKDEEILQVVTDALGMDPRAWTEHQKLVFSRLRETEPLQQSHIESGTP